MSMEDFEETPFDSGENDDSTVPDAGDSAEDAIDDEYLVPEWGDQFEYETGDGDADFTDQPEFSSNELGSPTPEPISPQLANFLSEHTDVAPDSIVSMLHVPKLIGGIKSTQFIITPPEATPDTPPDPTAVFDLSTATVNLSADEPQPFFGFFDGVEAQADKQYSVALFETEQLLADAIERGVEIDTIFIPDTVNATATGYFRRLARLAQDVGRDVVVHVAGSGSDGSYSNFRRFEPVQAEDIDAYWQARAQRIHARAPIRPPETSGTVAAQALEYAEPPADYHWAGRHEQVFALHNNLRIAARASPERLQELLLGEESPIHEKLSLIQEAAYGNPEAWGDQGIGPARMILAKIGDMAGLQQIRTELRDRTGGAGSIQQTSEPLGVYMRADRELLASILDEVEQMVANDPGWHEVHPLLGALYLTGDPSIGERLAETIIVPERHIRGYASQVLFAATRWMPQYVAELQAMSSSPERVASLAAIQDRIKAFLDADNDGRLEGISGYMTYKPHDLVATLFSFRNPEHQATLRQCVLTEFERGGSLLVDSIHGSISRFEQTYVMYREQYGDLPEISRMLKPQESQ